MDNNKISFWTTLAAVLVGLGVAFVSGGFVWGKIFRVQLIGWILISLLLGGYIFWRSVLHRTHMVKTRLEWVFGFFVFALMISWMMSPDMRQGLEKVGVFLGYLILYYIIVDAFDTGMHRGAVVLAVLSLSGVVLILACLEISVAYNIWWGEVGSRSIIPPYPYRFVSLVGHANSFMALINLCAPLALVVLIHRRSIIERVCAGVWIFFYILAIPFSFSRGGWLGMTVWIVCMVLLWFWDLHIWQRIKTWVEGSWIRYFSSVLVLVGLLSGGVFAIDRFVQLFASRPSLGRGTFGGRGEIWTNAIDVWRTNIIFGAGPGRFPFVYQNSGTSIPPGYWAGYAHSVFFQFLAEFGLIGFLALIMLLIVVSWRLWKCYQASTPDLRVWNRAIIAGGTAWVVHSFFDEVTTIPMMALFLLLLAWLIVPGRDKPQERWNGIEMTILGLPVLMLIVGAGWNLWAFFPTSKALAPNLDVRVRAELIERSLSRDPNLAFYPGQAGLAWADVWYESGENLSLLLARNFLRKSLEIEPSLILYWADLAILDWHAGFREAATDHMTTASQLAPDEPSFWLNLGWFSEEYGLGIKSAKQYKAALELAPGWAGHPFWEISDFRVSVVSEWKKENPGWESSEGSYWRKAQHAFVGGDLDEAKTLLAYSNWVKEPKIAMWIVEAQIMESQDDVNAAMLIYEKVATQIGRPNLRLANDFAKGVNSAYFRAGREGDLVPGYLQLENNYGQFAALEHLRELYIEKGECEKADRVHQLLFREINGGAVEFDRPILQCME